MQASESFLGIDIARTVSVLPSGCDCFDSGFHHEMIFAICGTWVGAVVMGKCCSSEGF